jgi:hypothetical protein
MLETASAVADGAIIEAQFTPNGVARARERLDTGSHCANRGRYVVDMQKDFLDDGAACFVPGGRSVVPALSALLAGFRSASLPTIHVITVWQKDGVNMSRFTTSDELMTRGLREGEPRGRADRRADAERERVCRAQDPHPENAQRCTRLGVQTECNAFATTILSQLPATRVACRVTLLAGIVALSRPRRGWLEA